jgi:hypothetical protein
MALKATEDFYKLLITMVIKEISEDPSTSNISHDAINQLEKVPNPIISRHFRSGDKNFRTLAALLLQTILIEYQFILIPYPLG